MDTKNIFRLILNPEMLFSGLELSSSGRRLTFSKMRNAIGL